MIQEIYRDPDLLVVAKPPGLLCVPGLVSPDNLFDRVKQVQPNARVVHRLDMATSGLVIFALHYNAQKALGKLFESRRIHKCYKAVVDGIPDSTKGEICLPLLCDWENRPRQKICWREGKTALTRFEVEHINLGSQTTSVRLYPVTGRTHQLRVHMQAVGHAIRGDTLYGPDSPVEQRLMLHAETLEFRQPLSGLELNLRAPCPF